MILHICFTIEAAISLRRVLLKKAREHSLNARECPGVGKECPGGNYVNDYVSY